MEDNSGIVASNNVTPEYFRRILKIIGATSDRPPVLFIHVVKHAWTRNGEHVQTIPNRKFEIKAKIIPSSDEIIVKTQAKVLLKC